MIFRRLFIFLSVFFWCAGFCFSCENSVVGKELIEGWKILNDAGETVLRKDIPNLQKVVDNLSEIKNIGYKQWKALQENSIFKGGDDLYTKIDDFSKAITDINKKYSDGSQLTQGKLESSINSASYYGSVREQGSAIFNSLIVGHVFNNGVKRTASEFIAKFASNNGLKLKLNPEGLKNLTIEMANGKHYEVDELTKLLFK